MKDTDLSEDIQSQVAKAIMENKPYLLEVEEHVASIKFGSIDMRLEVRGGTVTKVVFYEGSTWLKDQVKPDISSKIDVNQE